MSTLIDRIYTIVPEKAITAGICLADISDHLAVFCTMTNKLPVARRVRLITKEIFLDLMKERF